MNILTKRVHTTTISISTKELLENFRASINDIIWDARPDTNEDQMVYNAKQEIRRNIDILEEATLALVTGSPDAIVQLFADGCTMMLLGGEAFRTLERCNHKKLSVQVIVTDHLNNSIIIPDHKLQY